MPDHPKKSILEEAEEKAMQVKAGSVSLESRDEEIARLKADLAAAQGMLGLHFKVSPKKAVSVYGLGRFPTTLYPQQWLAVLAQAESMKAFIASHHDDLSWRDD